MDCEGGRDWWRVPFEYHGEPGKGKMKPRDDKNGPAWGFGRKVGQEGFEVRCELGVDAKVQVRFFSLLSWLFGTGSGSGSLGRLKTGQLRMELVEDVSGTRLGGWERRSGMSE